MISFVTFSDINECLGNNGCDQTCSNVDGSYTCSCRKGYLLQADDRSCTGEISIFSASKNIHIANN